MSLTKEQILDSIASMSIMEVVELTTMMENKFGISSSATLVSTDSDKKKVESIVEEQTEFNVFLTAIGTNKIPVIKAVRSITGLGLKESKELVESAPVILKESVSKNDSETFKKALEEVGATVEIK